MSDKGGGNFRSRHRVAVFPQFESSAQYTVLVLRRFVGVRSQMTPTRHQ